MSRHIHVQIICRKCDSSICPKYQGPKPEGHTSFSHGERQWCACHAVPATLPSMTWFLSLFSPFELCHLIPPDPTPALLEPLWESRLGCLAAASPSLPHCSSLASLVCCTRTWRRHSSHSSVIVTNWNGKQDKAPEEKLIMDCLVVRKWIYLSR